MKKDYSDENIAHENVNHTLVLTSLDKIICFICNTKRSIDTNRYHWTKQLKNTISELHGLAEPTIKRKSNLK